MRLPLLCMTGLVAGALCCALAASPASACGAGKVLLEDKFDSLDGWGNLTSDVSVKNNTMLVTQPPGRWYRFFNQTDFFTNVNICVEASIVAAGEITYHPYLSLLFWRVNSDQYRFTVSGNGQYFIGRDWNGRTTFPRSWTASDRLKKGLGQWNALEVRTRGNAASFRLNGAEVARINALQPQGGGLVGFEWAAGKDQQATLALRNLRIEAADRGGL